MATILRFDHVTDPRLRKILEQSSTDEDDLCYALTTTREAVDSDEGNEDVPSHVAAARTEAYERADVWWNDEGRGDKAVEALRRCWSI